ncbi:MAG TPA: HAD-IC family P-type ATPase, partial [Ktedonobacterales bacterium]|nr:HAD-IC family P-type ATPase [Ktedonobacterales bacterium]
MEAASQEPRSLIAKQGGALLAGLTDEEATARRARGEGNVAPPATGRSYWQILRENLFTFINITLFGLGFALALLGRWLDAIVSTCVILTNVVVSVVQEVRAKQTLDKIALLTRPQVTLIRSGQEREAPPDEIVIGDILKVEPGDQIVVDGKVVGAGRMSVDESQLTGESNLIEKKEGDPVYSGSFCVSGSAYYVTEKVGSQSLANEITAGARAFRRVLTPLQGQINLVIRIVLLIVVYFELLMVMNSFLKRINLAQSVENSAIIASLVPNGLFLSIAVAYAIGAVRIIRFGALVQQSNAIESLSNVDVLCMDKTGTLTANRLQLHSVQPFDGGDEADLRRILGVMAASTASPNKTTDAIIAACPEQACALVTEVPFSSARKWSAVAFDQSADGASPTLQGIYILGAPEMLRPHLGEPPTWKTVSDDVSELATQGLRVLVVAHYPDPTALEDRGDDSTLPDGLQPLGLISLSDVLRPDTRETLHSFIKAGVRPKIISGDNPETVSALAQQAGLGADIKLVSGVDLAKMDDRDFTEAAVTGTIFGRITPQQKERLVQSLRSRGHYVAMIGDGVNDVLSLKQANLGVAMQSGSQATRGVADIVLMGDSFASLAPAVLEGQRIVNGMTDILRLYLARICTMGLLIVSSLVIGFFPLALRQGSLIVLLSVGIPTVALAIWARPGTTSRKDLLPSLLHFVLPPMLMSTIIGLVLFYGVYVLLVTPLHLDYWDLFIRTSNPIIHTPVTNAQSALSAFLVFAGLLLVIFVEPPTPWWTGGDVLSGDWRPTWLALGLGALFILMELIPPLRDLFALERLGAVEWTLVIGST